MHLWIETILESVGVAFGEFQIVDMTTSDVFHLMVVCILVEMDVSKGLPEKIYLGLPWGI